SDRRMYSWIYHPGMPLAEQHEITGATIGVTKFKAGNYTVEYWDTYKGTLIEKVDTVVNDENGKSIQLKLPVVKNDIAIKIKPNQIQNVASKSPANCSNIRLPRSKKICRSGMCAPSPKIVRW